MKDIGTFLEQLRKAIGLKRGDFVNDIVDLRHYQRFVNGESTPYTDDFIKILAGTNLSINEAINIFLDEVVLERKQTTKLYNAIIRGNFKSFDYIKTTINEGAMIEMKNLLLYEYTLLINNHKKRLINDSTYTSSMKKLINYPNLLSNKLLSLYELMILGDLLYYVPSDEQTAILNKMILIINNEEHLINEFERNDKLLNLVSRIANFLGTNKNYDESIKMCDKGIAISLKYEEFYLLDYLYYYKALCLHELDKIPERNNAIVECYLILKSKKNKVETDRFLKWFKDDFKITDFKLFFTNNIDI